jgi:hypothetical protein
MSMRVPPWIVSDGLWRQRVEPLLPRKPRRFRYPGRKPLDDRLVLQGILFVLHTGSREVPNLGILGASNFRPPAGATRPRR